MPGVLSPSFAKIIASVFISLSSIPSNFASSKSFVHSRSLSFISPNEVAFPSLRSLPWVSHACIRRSSTVGPSATNSRWSSSSLLFFVITSNLTFSSPISSLSMSVVVNDELVVTMLLSELGVLSRLLPFLFGAPSASWLVDNIFSISALLTLPPVSKTLRNCSGLILFAITLVCWF